MLENLPDDLLKYIGFYLLPEEDNFFLHLTTKKLYKSSAFQTAKENNIFWIAHSGSLSHLIQYNQLFPEIMSESLKSELGETPLAIMRSLGHHSCINYLLVNRGAPYFRYNNLWDIYHSFLSRDECAQAFLFAEDYRKTMWGHNPEGLKFLLKLKKKYFDSSVRAPDPIAGAEELTGAKKSFFGDPQLEVSSAVIRNHPGILRILLENGANINEKGFSDEMLKRFSGDTGLEENIAREKVLKNFTPLADVPPLVNAAQLRRETIFKILLAHEASMPVSNISLSAITKSIEISPDAYYINLLKLRELLLEATQVNSDQKPALQALYNAALKEEAWKMVEPHLPILMNEFKEIYDSLRSRARDREIFYYSRANAMAIVRTFETSFLAKLFKLAARGSYEEIKNFWPHAAGIELIKILLTYQNDKGETVFNVLRNHKHQKCLDAFYENCKEFLQAISLKLKKERYSYIKPAALKLFIDVLICCDRTEELKSVELERPIEEANVNKSRDMRKFLVLQEALYLGHLELVQTLLSEGVSQRYNLCYAREAYILNRYNIALSNLRYIVAGAVARKQSALLAVLLAKKLDPNEKGPALKGLYEGSAVFQSIEVPVIFNAIEADDYEIVKLLLAYGAKISIKADEYTPYDFAIFSKHNRIAMLIKVAELYLEIGFFSRKSKIEAVQALYQVVIENQPLSILIPHQNILSAHEELEEVCKVLCPEALVPACALPIPQLKAPVVVPSVFASPSNPTQIIKPIGLTPTTPASPSSLNP